MDTSIKQQLWIVFQQESFLPNDTRVSTRRISEHGVRAAIRSLASMLERVFSSVVPAPAAALLVKMEELVNRDLFVQTAWKQMCQASVVATVNWTGFCGVLLAMLVDLPKMAAAAMATDDDYAQVLVQKQRKAPLSVTTSSPSASSLRRQVDPHPVEMFQASVSQPVGLDPTVRFGSRSRCPNILASPCRAINNAHEGYIIGSHRSAFGANDGWAGKPPEAPPSGHASHRFRS